MTIHIAIAIAIPPGPEGTETSSCPEKKGAALPEDWVTIGADGLSARRLTVTTLRDVCRRARSCKASHLAIFPVGMVPGRMDLQRLDETCLSHPEALVIGCRSKPSQPAGPPADRALSRFWLKIQTGRHLEDPASPIRIYPLAVIDHLRLYQSGKALETEILVKSAWADVPFQEVKLDDDQTAARSAEEPLWRTLWRFLLNIHYTLRSVLPVPHRKLVAGNGRSGDPISVWRPMRSLRTLLRENTSPTQLALAAALGVFLGTLPLIACHTLVIILASTYFRLNKVAALASSQLCMPPVVPALCIELGYLLRHGRFLTEISLETLGYQALERLYEWLIGALVLAPLLAVLIGGVTLVLARLAARGMAGIRNVNPSPGGDAGP
jgi:uncharacterized protein (DUF2062 family)